MRNKMGDQPEIAEKRRVEDTRRLQSKWIDAEMEKKLVEIGGFSKKQLYNRRGGPSDRGLALMLEPGDQIIEVLPGAVRIRTREGTVQTFYNLDAPQEFLKPTATASPIAAEPAGDAGPTDETDG